jgi:hypothetical protein
LNLWAPVWPVVFVHVFTNKKSAIVPCDDGIEV